MTLRAPPVGHAVRSLCSVADVLEITRDAAMLVPELSEAKRRARDALATRPGLTTVELLVRRTDGCIVLKSFGLRGGDRTRWNFGKPR